MSWQLAGSSLAVPLVDSGSEQANTAGTAFAGPLLLDWQLQGGTLQRAHMGAHYSERGGVHWDARG